MRAFLKLQRASVVYPVGPKAVEQRPLKKLLSKTLPWIGAGMALWVMTHPTQTLHLVDHVTLRAQVALDHAATPVVSVPTFTYATRFQAEDRMAKGEYDKAVPLFLRAASSQQSLLASGRALRAAVLSRNPALMEQAGQAYNAMLDEVSLQSNEILNSAGMKRGIKTDWRWKRLSISHLIEHWKMNSPTHFSQSEADALLALDQTQPGYFSYLGFYGIDERELLSQLNLGESGWREILHFQADYQAWLQGKWTSAENFAMAVSHELEVQRDHAEKLAPQTIVEEYLKGSDEREALITGLSPGSVQDVFIRDHLGKGFTPWQIYELWFEREMWGDDAHEVINPTIPLTVPEQKMRGLRQEVRTWLADIQTPQDLNAYYAKWEALVDAHPVEFAAWTTDDNLQLQLGGSPGFAIDWVKRAQGLSGVDASKMPALLGMSSSQIGVVELKRALALSASAFPVTTPKAPDGISMQEAQQDLQKAVQDVGLRRLQWPVSIPNTPDKVWQMAALLREANQELERVTHLHGEVLGLKGRSSLIFNSTAYTYQDGLTGGIKQNHVLTVNSVVMGQRSLGPVGHEWLHAFDMVNAENSASIRRSDEGLATVKHPVSAFSWNATQQDWKQWWRQTLYPHTNSHETQLAQQNLWLKDKVLLFPMLEGVFNQELALVRSGTWSPDISRRDWATVNASDVTLKDRKQLQKEIAYFQTMWTHPGQTQSASPWVNLSNQFQLGFQAVHALEDSTAYSGNAAEMAARAFASQLSEGMMIREGRVERLNSNFIYPAAAERIAEKQAWNTLFQSQQAWWTTLASMGVAPHYSATQLQVRRERINPPQPLKAMAPH